MVLTRTEALAALFARSGGRKVWAIDARGRGGVVADPGAKRSDGWRTFAEEWCRACVEGDDHWTELPPAPAGGFLEG